MTELELGNLREKLITRRRILIESVAGEASEVRTRLPISILDAAIEAVDKAIECERRTPSAQTLEPADHSARPLA